MFIYNAKVYPSSKSAEFIPCGYIEIKDGKITRVSGGTPIKISEEDIDVHGMRLYPGFIDIHTHMGLIGDGQGAEGEDVNEDSGTVTLPTLFGRVLPALSREWVPQTP